MVPAEHRKTRAEERTTTRQSRGYRRWSGASDLRLLARAIRAAAKITPASRADLDMSGVVISFMTLTSAARATSFVACFFIEYPDHINTEPIQLDVIRLRTIRKRCPQDCWDYSYESVPKWTDHASSSEYSGFCSFKGVCKRRLSGISSTLADASESQPHARFCEPTPFSIGWRSESEPASDRSPKRGAIRGDGTRSRIRLEWHQAGNQVAGDLHAAPCGATNAVIPPQHAPRGGSLD